MTVREKRFVKDLNPYMYFIKTRCAVVNCEVVVAQIYFTLSVLLNYAGPLCVCVQVLVLRV